jgi:hypothetical protein
MAAAIRPRGPAESFDLGFRMVRQWWRPIYGAWFLTVLPIYAAAAAGLERWPGATLLCLWWLRPLFDRVPLYVLSRCLFGERPTWRQTLGALPSLWRHQLVGALTWRRPDPWRSLHLPVRQLERLRGRERRARLRLLGTGCRRQALGLTVGCLLLEMGVLIGLFGLIHMFLPQPERFWKAFVENGVLADRWVGLLWLALFFVALSVVEPFYVGAGFALYLGQRTRFEGWDVEIALRRLAARLTAAPPGLARPRPAGVPVLLIGLCLALPAVGQALAPPALAAAGAATAAGQLGHQARAAVEEVFRAPEFETLDQEVHWVPRSPGARAAAADEDWDWPQAPPVPRRVKLGLLALAAAGGLALVLLRWRRVWLLPAAWRADAGVRPATAGTRAPLTVRGLDVRPSSLPADVPAAAWQLWERGEAVAALSLLYRGALAALMATTAIRFAESWTEGDCLNEVRRHAAADAGDAGAMGGQAEIFARLTASWQAAAYARREPDEPIMRDLCAGWRRTFEAPAAALAPAAPAADVAGPRGAATSKERRDWRRSEPRP